MYTIAHIIYGTPITSEISQRMLAMEQGNSPYNEEWYEGRDNQGPHECGFTILYSGAGNHAPGYCGIMLATFEAIPTYNYLLSNIEAYKNDLTHEQIQEVQERFNQLPLYLKEITLPIDFYLIFSTS